jgi:hypothetical protein
VDSVKTFETLRAALEAAVPATETSEYRGTTAQGCMVHVVKVGRSERVTLSMRPAPEQRLELAKRPDVFRHYPELP